MYVQPQCIQKAEFVFEFCCLSYFLTSNSTNDDVSLEDVAIYTIAVRVVIAFAAIDNMRSHCADLIGSCPMTLRSVLGGTETARLRSDKTYTAGSKRAVRGARVGSII